MQAQPDNRTPARLALDAETAAVALDDLRDLGQPAAPAADRSLIEDSVGHEARVLFGHADACVADLDDNPARLFAGCADAERTALGHRLDGVEDEPHEGITQLERDALDGRQRFHVLRDGDDDPAALGVVAPSWPRQVERLLDDGRESHGPEGDLRLA